MIDIRGVTRQCVLCGGLVLALVIPLETAHAAHLRVLYSFQGGNDGADPFGGVAKDNKGNIYGTTYYGGADDLGTVFKRTRDGSVSVLHSFTGGSDGATPQTDLIADAKGNLVGTTSAGGAKGCGTVFRITPKGRETVLYAFTCGAGGGDPSAGVVADKKGNLYGTTYGGGTGLGTVFKLARDGTEFVLHAFTGGSDGAEPIAGLIADGKGNLFGTTYGGGTAGLGTVFKVAPDGTESVLHAFTGGSDGSTPFAGLIADATGNLYGTTYYGGANSCGGNGCGTVFRVAQDGTETVLYSFAGGSDGMDPYGGLIDDANGNLYGTTLYGGGSGCSGNGCGIVFSLAPDGTKTTLHAFAGSDGTRPSANLAVDGNGNLYGTTFDGGGTGCGGSGCGVVFKLKK